MSEPERERRFRIQFRVAELAARHGEPEAHDAPVANPDPTWGPVGSLARTRMDPETYARLMALHNDMLALERSRKVAADGPSVLHPGRSGAVGTPQAAA